MALRAFPNISKTLRLTDGTSYAYVHVPPSSKNTTFFLLHGFPSSSYDWRHQIHDLTAAGYGVLAPDMLGYGDTDKPEQLEAYNLKTMCVQVMEIFEHEELKENVIGVGHDWGSGPLSRLANYYPQKFRAFVFVSVGYVDPGSTQDIDAVNAATEKAFGYPTFGYWKWFDTDEAADMLNQKPKAASSLMYPKDPELWKTDFCPTGTARAWISAGKSTELPGWMTEEESAMHDQIMARAGYAAPLKWYKSAMRGVNVADEAEFAHEDKILTLPTMLVVSTKDYATRAEMQLSRVKEWVKNLRVETLDCGHWIPLEKRDELTGFLKSFANEVGTD